MGVWPAVRQRGRRPKSITSGTYTHHLTTHHLADGEQGMAKKGYWIGHVDVTDSERYKDYIAANGAPLKKYGARFLVRNGVCEVPEGGLGGHRHVVIEFESYAAAKACYESPEYQAALAIRKAASTGDVVIIEGYEE
jgi:uncharacterized protein (DUF1330 family)